jgi:Tol biopolymer transport system component
MNADGTGQVNLSRNPQRDGWPSWSPDSTQIVFGSDRGESMQLYVMNVDGSGLRQLTRQPGVSRRPSWSPDGKRIVYECGQSR